jgi:hypothetical protein
MLCHIQAECRYAECHHAQCHHTECRSALHFVLISRHERKER